MPTEILRVQDLRIAFPGPGGEVPVVRGVSFRVSAGESLALVGESGCGKSVTGLSLLGLTPRPGRVVGGSVVLNGRETIGLSSSDLRNLRGQEIGMVFQEPMTSLDPVFTVGSQLAEAVAAGRRLPKREMRARSVELLHTVGVPEPERRLDAYPGELSGGLRQRVMIAIALACSPSLLIADEPTTALDVTIQAQVMELFDELRRDRGIALLLITHDLGLVWQHSDRVVVMYSGHAVEEGRTEELFRNPLHPYTRGLLGSMPVLLRNGKERGGRLGAIPGNVPDPSRVPSGCPFRDRCAAAKAECGDSLPAPVRDSDTHWARCVRLHESV